MVIAYLLQFFFSFFQEQSNLLFFNNIVRVLLDRLRLGSRRLYNRETCGHVLLVERGYKNILGKVVVETRAISE